MLRLRTLVTRTDPERLARKRKHPCVAKITKSELGIDDSGTFVLFLGRAVDLKTNRTLTRARSYPVLAKLYYDENSNNASNPRCFVWCDCHDFTFRLEVALALRGSSLIVNSNGAMPKITNPNAAPFLCKHMLAFIEKCVSEMHKRKSLKQSEIPVPAKPERELIESLKRPSRGNRSNVLRTFKTYFNKHGISGTHM